MRDISARELKGHNILAVERFQDSTRWMVEFAVRKPRTPYGAQPANQNQAVCPRCRGPYPRFQTEKETPSPVNLPSTKKGMNYVYR